MKHSNHCLGFFNFSPLHSVPSLLFSLLGTAALLPTGTGITVPVPYRARGKIENLRGFPKQDQNDLAAARCHAS